MHCVHTYRTGRATISWRWENSHLKSNKTENENSTFVVPQAVSDFHLLLYLFRMDMLPMKSAMSPLLNAVRTRDNTLALEWKKQEVWTTLETLIMASSVQSGWVMRIPDVLFVANKFSILSGSGNYPSESGQAGAETWTCDHCTFINGGNLNICEMCGLPM